MKSKLSRARARISGRYVLASALVLVVGVPTVAVGAGEGRDVRAGKRNPARGELNRETQIIAENGSYGTRQSNKGSGGGAIYGCRAAVGAEPCVRANNLTEGRAFEFETGGKEGGRIAVQDTTGVPFTTNATGRVENLNADKVDGREAADFAEAGSLAFAAVAADGTLGAKRGATAAAIADGTTGTYAVTFDRDVSACSFTATANAAGANGANAFAVQANAANKNQVLVDQADVVAERSAFHLQVIC